MSKPIDPNFPAFLSLWWATFQNKPKAAGELLPLAETAGVELVGNLRARQSTLGRMISQRAGEFGIAKADAVRGGLNHWSLSTAVHPA